MKPSEVKKSVLWLGFAEIINRLSALILLMAASRLLSPDEFSDYIVFLTFAGLLWVMAQMGTTMHGTRVVCKAKIKDRALIIGGITIMRLLLSVFFSIGLFVFQDIILPGIPFSLIILGVGFVIVKAVSIDWVLRAFDMSRFLAILLTISSTINGLLGVLLLFYAPIASSVAFAMLFSSLVICIASWMKIILTFRRRKFFSYNVKGFKFGFHFIRSSTIGLAGIAVIGSQSVPVLSLNWFSDAETIGLFGGVQRLLQIMLAPMAILSLAHFPQLARSLTGANVIIKFQDAYHHYFADLIICAIWLSVGLAISSGWLPALLLGDRFVGMNEFVTYIALLIPLYYFRASYSDSAIAMGNAKSVLYGCLASLMILLIISILLVPEASQQLQLNYSVVMLAISEVTILIITMFFLWKASGVVLFRTQYVGSVLIWFLIGGVLSGFFLKTLQTVPGVLIDTVSILLAIMVSVRLYEYSSFYKSTNK